MEKDIKILEDLKEKINFNHDKSKYENSTYIQAIENLLKRYKELEEENKKLIKANDNLKATKRIKTYREIEKHFIPISVIQNKIDEIKQDKDYKYYDMFLETRDIENTIEILQELLERKE